MADFYEFIVYPSAQDSFQEVADGRNPENKILAKYINKVQNALTRIQQHTVYTPQSPNATGSTLFVANAFLVLPQDRNEPGLNQPMNIVVPQDIANSYFGGSPFGRQNAIFATALGYKWVGGVRTYFPVRAGVNVRQENGNLNCTVNVVKGSRWRKDDVCQTTLTIVRP